MKKFAAISLVIFFLALPFVHLGKGVFIKDQGASSIKRSKKTVLISEITEDLYSLESLKGSWVLFLHYPDATASIDIAINAEGMSSSNDTSKINDLKTSIDKEGSVKMENDRIRLEGRINTEANHISGMAKIQGVKAPVPFSAFRIDSSSKGRSKGESGYNGVMIK